VRAAPVSIVDLDLRIGELENRFHVAAIPGVDRPLDDPSLLGVHSGAVSRSPRACRQAAGLVTAALDESGALHGKRLS
jgi:hypothetical protein